MLRMLAPSAALRRPLRPTLCATRGRAAREVAVIFAELDYDCSYDEAHDQLSSVLRRSFSMVEDGHQGDSWIWVHDGSVKVAIDTFSSMKHQVKSELPGEHVQRVLDALGRHYRLLIKNPPEPEGHE